MPANTNIVVTTHNRLALTKTCLDSIITHTNGNFELTVVDNASSDGTISYLQELKQQGLITRLILMKRNMGVAVASNIGWDSSEAPFYVKMDNDIEILEQNWLLELINVLEGNPSVGAAAYKFCPWHTTERITLEDGSPFDAFTGLGGGCVAIPKASHDAIGFWNEDYGFYGYEDLEFGIRLICAGKTCGYLCNDCAAQHLGWENAETKVEQRKKRQTTHKGTGKDLYLLNKFLFEYSLRPLNVPRKYQTLTNSDGTLSCTVAPQYQSYMKLQRHLLKNFEYTESTDGMIAVNVDKIQSALQTALTPPLPQNLKL